MQPKQGTWFDSLGARFTNSGDPRPPVRFLMRPFRFLAGLVITFMSALWLLMVAGFSSMIDPTLPGRDWWMEFLGRFTAPGLIGSTLLAWGIYLVLTSWQKVLPRIHWRLPRE